MKKTLILLIFLLSALATWARFDYTYKGVTLTYGIVDNGRCVVYACPQKNVDNVEIPARIKGDGPWNTYDVVGIGRHAFEGTSITSVKIPTSATTIGQAAFYGCTSLSSIEIPASVTDIGLSAFMGCTSLTSIEIPASVTDIDIQVFYGCTSLSSIKLPASVTSIGKNTFSHCTSLRSIEIPASVTSIGEFAFNRCISLSSIELPASVTSIGKAAFIDCNSLTAINVDSNNADYCSVDGVLFSKEKELLHTYPIGKTNSNYDIPASVNTIAYGAFADCSSLRSVNIPNSVTTINDRAFDGCYRLTSVFIPNSVTAIESTVFSGCSSLKTVTIPNTVTSIGNMAFCGCSSLSSITIPNSVTAIYSQAFSACSSLKSVIIPNSVTTIDWRAFAFCNNLSSVTVSNSITSVDKEVFYECPNLIKVYYGADEPLWTSKEVFSDYLKPTLYVKESALSKIKYTIPWSKFTKIETFDFPEIKLDTHSLTMKVGATTTLNVTKEGNLSELTWASSNPEVATVDSNGIVTASAVGATTITVSATDLNTNDTVSTSCLIDVKNYTLDYYFKSTTFTAAVTGISVMEDADNVDVVIPEYVTHEGRQYKVTELWHSAFKGYDNLSSVTIPGSVTSIGESTFGSCTKLVAINVSIENQNYCSLNGVLLNKDKTTLYCYPVGKTDSNYKIPNSVTIIDRYAFYECSSLTSITIPNSVITIRDCAFQGCSGLTEISIPNSVTSIGVQTFLYCKSLKSATLPNSISTIPVSTFGSCSSLTDVKIPDSVKEIGSCAFMRCSALTSIDIPDQVTSIADLAFYDCAVLQSVKLPRSLKRINAQAFAICPNLTEIVLPSSVENLEYGAFRGCRGLTSVTLPDSVTKIGALVFAYCPSLEKIYYRADDPVAANENVFSDYSKPKLYVKAGAIDKIKATVPWSLFEKVETYDFPDDKSYIFSYEYETVTNTASIVGIQAKGIVDVIIPVVADINGDKYTITGIRSWAFAGKDVLRSVTIPSTVRDIDPGAFRGCVNLETVNYYPVTVNTTDSHHANPVFSNCPKFKNLNIGETVQEIPKYMFRTIDIETLDIPNNVESLLSDCFADCYKLAEIRLGRGVRSIECASFALGMQSSLPTKVYCNTREITRYRGFGGGTGSYMPFSNRTVASIEFDHDVELLADYAFSDVKPGDIYCNGTTPPVVTNVHVLKSVDKSVCALHVLAGSLALYHNAYFWKDFYNIKGDLSGIDDVVVEDNAPMEVYNLNGLKVADSLEGLAPGLYIVCRGTCAEKVLVRP